MLREQIRLVAAGKRPLYVSDLRPNPIPTYGGDTVLAIKQRQDPEGEYLSKLAHELMDIQYEADELLEPERAAWVTESMRGIEQREQAGD